MKKGEATRNRVLDVAGGLLRRQGYHATGVLEILDRSRAPRGSLYFHFPGGKDELVANALRSSARAWQIELLATFDAMSGDLGRALQAVAKALADELERSAFRHGCPLATVTLEVAADNEPLRAVLADSYRSWESLIAERLVATGIAAARARPLATVILGALEGALVLSRAYRDTEPVRRAAAAITDLLAAAIAPAPRSKLPRRAGVTARRATPRSPRAPAGPRRPRVASRRGRSGARTAPHRR